MKQMPLNKFCAAAVLAGGMCVAAYGLDLNYGKDNMKFELVELEYNTNALEPVIDQLTVGTHHGKHQATYVNNLNAALESAPEFKFEGSLEELMSDLGKVPEKIRTAVRNNGGGVWNHTFYWRGFSPEKTEMSPKLKAAIEKAFGSVDEMKKQFNAAGAGRFGSGWVWLGVDPKGELKICTTPNQDSPIMGKEVSGCDIIPIYTIDVWEHAYYLKYLNLRAKHLEAVWDITNWKRVSDRYEKALSEKKVQL